MLYSSSANKQNLDRLGEPYVILVSYPITKSLIARKSPTQLFERVCTFDQKKEPMSGQIADYVFKYKTLVP